MKINHEDARLLRETLARIHTRYPHPELQKLINTRLKMYAERVGKYCEHPDKGLIDKLPYKKVFGCLDCGMRFITPLMNK